MASSADRAKQIKDLLADNPGLNSRAVARELGVSPATVSLVLRGLKDTDQIEQRRAGRGMGLHLTSSATKRRIITQKWGK